MIPVAGKLGSRRQIFSMGIRYRYIKKVSFRTVFDRLGHRNRLRSIVDWWQYELKHYVGIHEALYLKFLGAQLGKCKDIHIEVENAA